MGLVLLSLVACVSVVTVIAVIKDDQSARYPGAVEISEHHIRKLYPTLYLKENLSFHSSDDFPTVYNWYSHRFSLGGEAQAQSRCSHLSTSDTDFAVTRSTSVTICDTPDGQLIYVQRTASVRWARPLTSR